MINYYISLPLGINLTPNKKSKMFKHSNNSAFKKWKPVPFYRVPYCEIFELISHDEKLIEEYKQVYMKKNIISFINTLKIYVDKENNVKLIKK